MSDREAADYFQYYLAHFERNWIPYEDVLPCLQQLTDQRLGIITNGDQKQQLLKLERMGILDYFEVVISSDEVGFSKPDRRIFEIACDKTGIPLHEMVYIGDDIATDIVPCDTLGITGIWINRRNERPSRPVKRAISSLDVLFEHLLNKGSRD